MRPWKKNLIALGTVTALALGVASCAQQPTASPQASTSAVASSGTRVILLGTAGGPSIKAARVQPSNAIVVNDAVYIIDAGDGVARQMGLAGLNPKKLRAVFITHNHSDHIADYGTLLLRSWASGLTTDVQTFGPPLLAQMTQDYLDFASWDINLRVANENHPNLMKMVHPTEVASDGVVYQDENVKVTAFLVDHREVKPALGYRFDTADKSVVFSGDTRFNENLIRHAQGADILVHEVVSEEGAKAIAERISPGNKEFLAHIIEAHTTAEQVGEVARRAQVGKLVLNHFVPTGIPAFDNPDHWVQGVRKTYAGDLVIGEDLLEID